MELPYVFCVCGDGVKLLILCPPSAPLPFTSDVTLHFSAVLILVAEFEFFAVMLHTDYIWKLSHNAAIIFTD